MGTPLLRRSRYVPAISRESGREQTADRPVPARNKAHTQKVLATGKGSLLSAPGWVGEKERAVASQPRRFRFLKSVGVDRPLTSLSPLGLKRSRREPRLLLDRGENGRESSACLSARKTPALFFTDNE